jgi:UDP-N-acetyl-D-glucosamine dehydrogenase
VDDGLVSATTDYDEIRDADAILVALPTPLSRQREPDLRILVSAAEQISTRLRAGHLVVLESTTYPGTTREQVQPILERGSGLEAGRDFHLAFSPERVDPGREDWTTKNVPKVVGGVDASSTESAAALYGSAIDNIYRVSSPEAAELTKLLENIFRSVNIALVNELAQLCDRMGIDVWEVIDAAATKPFGFMSFQPGPGLGGHCIPVDPYYLSWKAREFDFSTRFIELAGEVNTAMPYNVVESIASALNERQKPLKGSRVLVLGVAYKKDVDDLRESPTLKIMQLLSERGALIDYNDPYFPQLHKMRHYDFAHMASVNLDPATLASYDCAIIATDHSSYDYDAIVESSQLVVDTRNVTRRIVRNRGKIVLC